MTIGLDLKHQDDTSIKPKNKNTFRDDVRKVVVDEAGRRIEEIDAQLEQLKNEKSTIQENLYSATQPTNGDKNVSRVVEGDKYKFIVRERRQLKFNEDQYKEVEDALNKIALRETSSETAEKVLKAIGAVTKVEKKVDAKAYDHFIQSSDCKRFIEQIVTIKFRRPTMMFEPINKKQEES